MRKTALALLIGSALLAACPLLYAQLSDDQADSLFKKGAAGDADAVASMRKSASQGDAIAQFFLGVMLDNGRGVEQNFADAAKWFRKAADQGNAMAQNNLGAMYLNGRGVAQNSVEAANWYRKAAEQGYAGAQFNLGLMYANGRTMASDLSRSVQKGVMSAYDRGVPQDDAEAVKWFRAAAEQGDAGAQFNLGIMFANGRGVARDDAEAVKWYRLAAVQGDAVAQFNLGARYANGQGVPQDYVQAYKWWAISKRTSNPGSAVYESDGKNMDILAKKISAAELARAQQEAAAWTVAAHSGTK